MHMRRIAWRGLTATTALTAGVLFAAPAVYAGTLHNDVRIRTHAGKCFDVKGASTNNDVPIVQYTCGGRANQRFRLRGVGDGFWQIRTHAGKCLDVRSASGNDNAPIIQYACTGRTNQRFRIVDARNGMVEFRTHVGKCLDVRAASTSNDAPIIQYTCTGRANQRFTLEQL